jgi:hypothetical protein
MIEIKTTINAIVGERLWSSKIYQTFWAGISGYLFNISYKVKCAILP